MLVGVVEVGGMYMLILLCFVNMSVAVGSRHRRNMRVVIRGALEKAS